jgi:hypothetical protein
MLACALGLAAALLASAGPAPAAPAPAPVPLAPERILARAKEAQGGSAWDAVRTLRLEGTLSVGGVDGRVESLTDVRTGRFRDAYELGPMKGANGFDGKDAWSQDASGQSRVDGAETPRRTAVTESYRRALAWWYPARHAAEIRSLGERGEGGRRFHVLAITPEGGRSFELWVDAATWLFDRTVEKIDADTFVTFLGDWRDVGGPKTWFSARTVRVGDEGKHDQKVTLSRLERDVPVDDARFARPAPPPRDFGFAGEKRSTTVPFTIANGHIYVDVKLNGRGPFRILLDSGGLNVVTPAVARELGLEVKGELPISGAGEKVEDTGLAKVERIDVGEAFLERQAFFVFPLDEMAPVEGVPQQGLLGYEVFRRFVARIDYEHRQLTLLDAAGFRYAGPGTVLPFVFNEHIPQVDGEVDGIPGKFDLDTGSRASLDLMSPFVAKHGLVEKLHATPDRITGWGVGGPVRSRLARPRSLKLGPVEIAGPVTGLAAGVRGFASPDVAGNVGYGVLSRFTVVFDYGRQQVILEKNAGFGRRDVYDKSGLWLHAGDGAWDVMEVVPGAPAARAGLAVGDRILAVDGKTPATLSLPELRSRLREPADGTEVVLRIRRGKEERTVKLVLRESV